MRYEESPAERAIREAMERGDFDNLPGKGKPLPDPDDALTPPDLRLVHHILKNANVTPEWMQVRDEIERGRAAVASLRKRLEAEYPVRRERADAVSAKRQENRQAFADWHADLRAAIERGMRQVNGRILTLNLRAPAGAHPEIPYKVDEEMARLDAEFPPLPDVTVERHEEKPKRDPEDILRNVLLQRFRRG